MNAGFWRGQGAFDRAGSVLPNRVGELPPNRVSDVSFNRDVRPILSNYCFKCHGPDAKARKAKLRLDTRVGLFGPRDNGPAVVPGKPELSDLIRHVTARDVDKRMPPPSTKRELSVAQIDVLRRWIGQGAAWEVHWAFTRPVRPDLPDSGGSGWPITVIDRFVRSKFEREGLRPSPRAERRRLLRRVTLDLTGLPPTPNELAAFVADRSADAYEKVVDRLLAQPSYGERMAWDWLDAARYADTNGFQGDQTRTMWPYRDWVVDALNANLPYDKFLTWQLAGDLLPDATFEQRLATAFCRNSMINGEGGRIAEENRVEYVFDSVETIGTVFLGLTMTCARCHDHKFDPVSQRNYYQLFAYFNQTPVTGAGGNPQTPPVEVVRSDAERAKVARLKADVRELDRRLQARKSELMAGLAEWERMIEVGAGTDSWTQLVPVRAQSRAGQEMAIHSDRTVLVSGKNPAKDTYTVEFELPPGSISGLRLEVLQHESMAKGGLARSDSGNFVLTGIEAVVEQPDQAGLNIAMESAVATFEQGRHQARLAFDGKSNTGWAVYNGRFVDRGHAAVFRFKRPVVTAPTSTLVVTLRHESKHANHNIGRFRLSVTSDERPDLTHSDTGLDDVVQKPAASRTAAEAKRIESAYLATDAEYGRASRSRDKANSRSAGFEKASGKVRVMVMTERSGEQRKTYVLYKGLYNQRREEVTAGVPQVLPPLAENAPPNRLSLAEWLVDPDHPLTARVVVNRHWQKFFGTGLVKTVADFGAQGEKPSHPKLLSWLATEFVRTGWDVKALHRLIVTSATYRQTARADPAAIARDPENRMLARGPRHRLPSWMIRDLALAVSGLLVEKRGGPAVRPYQPAGVWAEATFGKQRYKADSGESLYRRSLYTFWRRIIGPTMFFDTAKRQTCSVGVFRTNTPLHALVTLNDTTYVEAARALAERVLSGRGRDAESKLAMAFEVATSRSPTATELDLLLARLAILRREYGARPGEAEKMITVGASARNADLDPIEHAAWTGVCSLILNLDETLNN